MAKGKAPIERIYLDTCVFTAYINNEPERAALAEEYLQACADDKLEIVTSMWTITEVAFAEIERNNNSLSDEFLEKIDALWIPPSKIQLVEVHELINRDARDLMRWAIGNSKPPDLWRIKCKDAIHVVSAKRSGCLKMYTYDTALERFSDRVGVKITAPQRLTDQQALPFGEARRNDA